MYSLYFTIGFSPEFIIPRLLTLGVRDVAHVWLLRVKIGRPEDRRSEYAALLVKQALGLQVSVDEIVLCPSDISSMLCTIAERMFHDVLGGRKLLVNISGGPRILVIATLLATITVRAVSRSASIRIEIIPEYAVDRGEIIDITSLLHAVTYGLEHIVAKVRQSRLEDILMIALAKSEVTARELADKLGVKESTVSNYLYELVQYGLIETSHRGVYKLTPMGKALATLLRRLHSRSDLS